jgi:hypothetical protein
MFARPIAVFDGETGMPRRFDDNAPTAEMVVS